MESPYKDSWPDVCVCVCLYLCVLVIYYNAKNLFLITEIIYWREIYKIYLGN